MQDAFLKVIALSLALGGILACNVSLGGKGSSTPTPPDAATSPASGQSECTSRVTALRASLRLSDDAGVAPTGALAVGDALASDLVTSLVAAGLTSDAAQFLAAMANKEATQAIGALSIEADPITVVAPSIVKGAFQNMTDPCAGGSDVEHRFLLADTVMGSVTTSLGKHAKTSSPGDLDSTLNRMAKSAVQALPRAQLDGAALPRALAAVTSGTVAALPKAGFAQEALGNAFAAVSSGAVTGLADARHPAGEVGPLAGVVASSALQGIDRAGLGKTLVLQLNIIVRIVAGSTSALLVAGVDAKGLGGAIGAIVSPLIRTLSGLGFAGEDRKGAVAEAVVGALDGALALGDGEATIMIDVISQVTQTIVTSLPDAGFAAGEISDAISVVIEAGFDGLAAVAGVPVELVVGFTKELVAGAMAGAGTLAGSGSLDANQTVAAGQAIVAEALSALTALQESGVLADTSDVAACAEAVNTGIASGLESSGAPASLASDVQTSTGDLVAQTLETATPIPPRAALQLTAGEAWPIALPATTVLRRYTLTNVGSAAASSLTLSTAAPFAVAATSTCPATLAAGSSCQIDVEFNPTSTSAHTAALSVAYEDGVATASVAEPLSAQAVDFTISGNTTLGASVVGTTDTEQLTVTNASPQALSLSLSIDASSHGFQIATHDCGSLAANGSCQVTISFSAAASGAAASQLTIRLGALSKAVELTATGLNPAALAFDNPSQTQLTNVWVTQTASLTLTVTNSGSVAATGIGAPSLPAGFSQTSTTCSTSLAPAASCQYVLAFAPSAHQSYSGSFFVSYHNGASSVTLTKALTANGRTPAALAFDTPSQTQLTNVSTWQTASLTLTLTNAGGTSATALDALSLPVSFSQSATTCSTSLAPGASCTYTIQFAPSAAQSYSGNASVSYDDGLASASATRALAGSGRTAALLSFDNPSQQELLQTLPTYTSSLTLTVTNSGTVSATSIGTPSLPSGFSLTSTTCTTSLAASASCQYVLQFAPTALQSYSGNLSISYDDGGGTATATKALTAAGAKPTVSPTYSNAAQWMDYAAAGSDTACGATGRCDHGGEFRTVKIVGIDSCNDLTMTDANGWFDWACVDVGSMVEFRSKRLKLSVRLEDLIEVGAGSSHDWLPNSVTLKQGATTIASSAAARWWTNPISDLPDTSGGTAPYTLDSEGTVFVVRHDATTTGLDFEASRQGLVIYRGKTLKYSTASPSVMLNGYGTIEKVWLEGNYDGNGIYATILLIGDDPIPNSDHWTVRHASFRGNRGNTWGVRAYGDRHRFENVSIADIGMGGNQAGECLAVEGTESILYNIKATNCYGIAMYFGYGAQGNILHNLIATNASSGLNFGWAHASQNTATHAVLVNNSGRDGAIEIYSGSSSNTLVNMAVIGNATAGLAVSNVNGNKFSQMIFGKNGGSDIGIMSSGNSHQFFHGLYVDSGNDCVINESNPATLINIRTKAAAGTGCEVNSDVASTGVTITEHAHSFGTSFVGYVTSDTANTVDASGVASATNISTAGQWHSFDSFHRAWTRAYNGNAFPSIDYLGLCDGACQIFDYRLRSTDTVLREVNGAFTNGAACPASVHGDAVITDNHSLGSNKFLVNAQEVIDDAIGDNDGLCESSEACIYSPNLGIYQGEGDYKTRSCSFVDSTSGNVTGVTMYAYPTNGV
jgi:hypothetical protein